MKLKMLHANRRVNHSLLDERPNDLAQSSQAEIHMAYIMALVTEKTNRW